MEHKRIETDELIHRGKVASVHKIGLRMPDGKVVQRDLFRYCPAALVLPVLDDGSIVMIRNYRFAVDEHLWELPAGMVEPGEDPQVCAARELTEETGYTAGNIEKLAAYYTCPGTTDETMHGFLATDLTPGKQALETYEEITVEVFSDDRVRAMIADGQIHDGKTIALLGLYWLRNGTV